MRAGASQAAPGSGSAALTAARAEVVRAGTASGAGRLPAVCRAAAPGVLAAAAASVAVFGDGGFAPSARVAFAAVAALALVAAFACEPSEAARLIRSPVVVVLLALAALAAVSAVWTVASPGASFRWAAVTAGYAGVTVAAAVAARRHGPAPLAVLVCVLAAATAAIGLAAAAAFQLPYAERIGGAWRPGGSFEYPPALALAQVCALPAQLSGMCSRRAWLAGPAALAAAGAAAVLALADSRTALMLAAATASVGLAVHGRERRAKLGAALALTLGAGVAAQLVAGGFVPRGHSSPETARGLSLAAICSLAPVCWLAIRSALARIAPSAGSRTVSPLRAAILASALAAAALAVGTAVFTEPSGSGAETSGGFAHGRAHTWRAALDTWGDRPIAGAGADAFLTAGARHRHDGVRF